MESFVRLPHAFFHKKAVKDVTTCYEFFNVDALPVHLLRQVVFSLGALLGLSWALLSALETLLGAILSDLGSLQHVLRCSLEKKWPKDALYVVFLFEF